MLIYTLELIGKGVFFESPSLMEVSKLQTKINNHFNSSCTIMGVRRIEVSNVCL